MNTTQATAEAFWSAFTALSKDEKRAVIQYLIQDEELRHDLMDLAVVEERRKEPGRSLREYLSEKEKKR